MNTNYLKKIISPLRKYPSKIIIWVSLLIITSFNISYENWNHEYKIIAWDVNSYYAYLPMVFIYHDIDMDFKLDHPEKAAKHYWPIVTETGKKAIITSMGMAYLYCPFFLAGHEIASLTTFAGDEFSAPYKISLIISCLFYLTIGLIFLRKVLRMYFSDLVTSITLLMIVLGTNLLHYTTDEPTMSHAYNFSLIAIFMYFLIKWFEKPGIKYALITGALAGLISLVRPSNVLVILLFVFWGITSFSDLGQRIVFYLRKAHLVLLMILAFILVWLPQFLYWDYTSGSIFFNTYGSVGASFFFDSPQIFYTLFSYRKGWLVYTPLMVLAIIGLYMLYKQHRQLFFPVFIYLILNVYVISSWWCWWFGGGHGLRSFIDFYPLMALPLAAFIAFFLRQRIYFKLPALLLLGALLYFNIFQTVQYRRNLLHYVMMTKVSYWDIFLDLKAPSHVYWDNLVYPDYIGAKVGEYYTEYEIPYGLEQQLGGMRGRTYVDQLADSLSKQPEKVDELIMMDQGKGTSVDSLVYREAFRIFLEIKEDYFKEKNK